MNARACCLVPALLFAAAILPASPLLAQERREIDVREVIAQLRGVRDNNAANGYLPLLKDVLTAELHFVKKVCNPTDDQFSDIHRIGLEATEQLADTYVDLKRRRKKPATWPDPNEAITKSLQEAVTRLFPADAAETYRAELAGRMDARRAADVATMVILIDRQVLLDPDQQTEISMGIRSAWKPHWSNANVVLFYPPYAAVPEADVLRRHLSQAQQRLWSFRPKPRNVTLPWNLNFGLSEIFGVDGLQPFADPNVTIDIVEPE